MRPRRTTTACRRRARWKLTPGAAYLHYTPNETIGGVEFPYVPDAGCVPLVADMSSTILSRPIDVTKFGLIYAGAQKNIGPSGIARRDRARGPHRQGARRHADGAGTTRQWPTKARCSTRRRRSAGTSPVSCSSGSSARAGSPRWRERNRAKADALYAAIDGSRLLPQSRREERALVDERAVHAGAAGARQAVSRGGATGRA